MGIQVIQGGLLTTVQDLGRFSYQCYGVSPAGAMDRRSLRIANYLVHNQEEEAGDCDHAHSHPPVHYGYFRL